MAISITVRVPYTVADQPDELAGTLERSRAYLVKKRRWRCISFEQADYLIVLERLRDKDDDILSSQEVNNPPGSSD